MKRSGSNVRESFEWLSNDAVNYFNLLELKNKLKTGLSSGGTECMWSMPY